MSNRAEEMLLALNNQIKHAPPQKTPPSDTPNQQTTPSSDKLKPKYNLHSELTSEIL